MKTNESTAIVHPDVVLVPYRKEHVAKYHEWMTSDELRELTASEPLTLEEEYEMQRKWQEDEDSACRLVLFDSSDSEPRSEMARPRLTPLTPLARFPAPTGGLPTPATPHAELTFILLLGPERFTSDPPPQQHGDVGLPNSNPNLAIAHLEKLPMIGDVNLFFKGARGGDNDGDDFEVEVEIMIAEPAYRRQGIAYTALQLLLSYATDPASPPPLPVPRERLVARIGEKNEPSIRLFEKLGFTVTKRVAVFEEVELRFTDASRAWTKGSVRVLDG